MRGFEWNLLARGNFVLSWDLKVRLGGNLDSRDRSTIIVLFLSFFFFSRLELFRDRNSRWRNFFDSFVGFEVRLDLRIRDSFISE